MTKHYHLEMKFKTSNALTMPSRLCQQQFRNEL